MHKSLKELHKTTADEMMARELYSPKKPYQINRSDFDRTLSYINNNIFLNRNFEAYLLNLSIDNTLSRDSIYHLHRHLALMVADNMRKYNVSDQYLNITKKTKLKDIFLIKDFFITPNVSNRFLKDLVNFESVEKVLFIQKSKDYGFEANKALKDYSLKNLGKGIQRLREEMLSQNLYSGEVKLDTIINLYNNSNSITSNGDLRFYNRRLRIYKMDYVVIANDIDNDDLDVLWQNNILNTTNPIYFSKESGEFGNTEKNLFEEKGVNSKNLIASSTVYNMDTVHDINQKLIENNESDELIWGLSNPFSFASKHGLLQQTQQILTDQNSDKGHYINQQSKIFKSPDGSIVYKANPCRNWIVNEYYGQDETTFKRYKPNGRDFSVAKNSIRPKIHPIFENSSINNQHLMLSIENLAYTYSDLIENSIPLCEHGENYGRKMWFAPYIKSYGESLTSSYQEHNFIGRTETLYTHKNTKRTGNLELVMIIDYPMPMDYMNVKDFYKFICRSDHKFTRIGGTPDQNGKNIDYTQFYPDFRESSLTKINKKVEDDKKSKDNKNNGSTTVDDNNSTNITPTPNPNPQDDDFTGALVDLNYYFGTDLFQMVNNYEHFTPSAQSTGVTSQGLNIPFIYENNTNNDENLIVDNLNFNAYNLITQNFMNLLPQNDNKILRIIASASTKFNPANSKTHPNIYNLYLSARRCFSLLKNYFDNYVVLNEVDNYILDTTNQLNQNFLKLNNLQNQNLTLRDFTENHENFFPKNSYFPGFKYYFDENNIKNNILTFIYRNLDDKLKNKQIIVEMIGRSAAKNKGSDDITTDEIQDRYVKTLIQKNSDYIIDKQKDDDESKTNDGLPDLDDFNDENTIIQNDKDIENLIKYNVKVINPGQDEPTNCYGRFSNKENMQRQGQLFNYIADTYGFNQMRDFVPAFHSQTPEDYHRRRTFLNQLCYPGNSTSIFGAKNSSFGRSPIAILRIGDILHSKVVINSISFSEELIWDLNPEGMGVQPMMTTVKLDFTIIGGQSLKTHIDQLQNAMSFNHYANSTYYGKNSTGFYKYSMQNQDEQSKLNDKRKEFIDKQFQIDTSIDPNLITQPFTRIT